MERTGPKAREKAGLVVRESNRTKPALSIRDLQEPLQVLEPTNTLTPKLKKTALTKTKEKLREGLQRQEDLRKQKSVKGFKLG